jgi:hypothetical protein
LPEGLLASAGVVFISLFSSDQLGDVGKSDVMVMSAVTGFIGGLLGFGTLLEWLVFDPQIFPFSAKLLWFVIVPVALTSVAAMWVFTRAFEQEL